MNIRSESQIGSGASPSPPKGGPQKDADDKQAQSIFDLLTRGAQASLDHIEEPTAADLAAIDEFDDAEDFDVALDDALELRPALDLLAAAEEPELVSLEGLDDIEEPESPAEELDDVEELLEDVESLIEDYIDVDLDDEELDDEGYDPDDDEDDVSSYHDLYGDDDAIIPSFREGEFAEEEESDSAYYDDLR